MTFEPPLLLLLMLLLLLLMLLLLLLILLLLLLLLMLLMLMLLLLLMLMLTLLLLMLMLTLLLLLLLLMLLRNLVRARNVLTSCGDTIHERRGCDEAENHQGRTDLQRWGVDVDDRKRRRGLGVNVQWMGCTGARPQTRKNGSVAVEKGEGEEMTMKRDRWFEINCCGAELNRWLKSAGLTRQEWHGSCAGGEQFIRWARKALDCAARKSVKK
jgi:membrane protein implicated in regulation of membrane protease activity